MVSVLLSKKPSSFFSRLWPEGNVPPREHRSAPFFGADRCQRKSGGGKLSELREVSYLQIWS